MKNILWILFVFIFPVSTLIAEVNKPVITATVEAAVNSKTALSDSVGKSVSTTAITKPVLVKTKTKQVAGKNVSSTAKVDASANSLTAKKGPSFVSEVLDVFMPDKVTSTSHDDIIEIGGTMSNDNQLNTSDQPIGFKTSSPDQTSINWDGFVQLKYSRLAVKAQPFPHRMDLHTEYYGSSLGKFGVIKEVALSGQVYAIDNNVWGLSLGAGAIHTRLDGTLKIGGAPLINEVNEWSAMYQATYWYHLNNHWSLNLGWELDNIRVVTHIPGVSDLSTTFQGGPFASLSLGWFASR